MEPFLQESCTIPTFLEVETRVEEAEFRIRAPPRTVVLQFVVKNLIPPHGWPAGEESLRYTVAYYSRFSLIEKNKPKNCCTALYANYQYIMLTFTYAIESE